MNEGTKKMLRSLGFEEKIDKVELGFCPMCDSPISNDEFTDELSRKEYDISGMCQKCQNEMFVEEE